MFQSDLGNRAKSKSSSQKSVHFPVKHGVAFIFSGMIICKVIFPNPHIFVPNLADSSAMQPEIVPCPADLGTFRVCNVPLGVCDKEIFGYPAPTPETLGEPRRKITIF